MKQLSHFDDKFTKKQSSIILLLDNITGEANIGSIFRIADAFNIEKIVFWGTVPNLKSRRLQKTARNTHRTVAFEIIENAEHFCNEMRAKYQLCALEITSESVPMEAFEFSEEKEGVILILGNEVSGIQENLLKISEQQLHINMFGKNSSMNVAQAGGIALYEISKTISVFKKK